MVEKKILVVGLENCGKTSIILSTSSSVLYRLKLKRTEPWIAVKGTFIARRTCDGSSEPDVQAEPLDAQIPEPLS